MTTTILKWPTSISRKTPSMHHHGLQGDLIPISSNIFVWHRHSTRNSIYIEPIIALKYICTNLTIHVFLTNLATQIFNRSKIWWYDTSGEDIDAVQLNGHWCIHNTFHGVILELNTKRLINIGWAGTFFNAFFVSVTRRFYVEVLCARILTILLKIHYAYGWLGLNQRQMQVFSSISSN